MVEGEHDPASRPQRLGERPTTQIWNLEPFDDVQIIERVLRPIRTGGFVKRNSAERSTLEFEAFVTETADPLFRSGYLMTANVAETEDLLQETFLRVARHWNRVRSMEYPARLRPSDSHRPGARWGCIARPSRPGVEEPRSNSNWTKGGTSEA